MFANLASDQVSEGIVRPDAQENADDEHAAPRVGQRCTHDYDARKEKTCVRRTEKAHADIGHARTQPKHVPNDKREQKRDAHVQRADHTEEVHAYGVEHRGDDAEHLIRELRVGAQHVVELASANPRCRAQNTSVEMSLTRMHTMHKVT